MLFDKLGKARQDQHAGAGLLIDTAVDPIADHQIIDIKPEILARH